jgi:hypothetical protein
LSPYGRRLETIIILEKRRQKIINKKKSPNCLHFSKVIIINLFNFWWRVDCGGLEARGKLVATSKGGWFHHSLNKTQSFALKILVKVKEVKPL